MLLRIDHVTEYRFREPVELTPHRLRLLPRSAPGLQLIRSEQTITPEVPMRWNLDAEGNLVGDVLFPTKADRLLISSHLLLEQKLTNPFDFLLDGRAMHLPIAYNIREAALLAPFIETHDTASSEEVAALIRPFLNGVSAKPNTLDFLTALNRAIPALFRYSERHEEGVQSAEETIAKREGTCRDFAHLFMESVRSVGIASRYVSGYLCSSPGHREENHTHGWCEVYLPGAGWRGFDPTSGILAGPHHVVVASSAAAGDSPPVEGSYCGEPGLCIAHEVKISAHELLPGEEP
jgi:transglutaminase-like putative cysteine protease